MYPMLELSPGQLLCDTQAIASYLVQTSGNKSGLMGSGLQQNEIEQWMDYIKLQIVPLAKAL